MYPRFAKTRIEGALSDTLVVLISGPRQSGKATLAMDIAADKTPFLTLGDATVLRSERVASDRPPQFFRLRLEVVEIIDRALRMGRGLEDGPLVRAKNIDPTLDIGSVIKPRLELGNNVEVSAEHGGSELHEQFFARAIRSVLVVAAEIPVQPVGSGCPMQGFVRPDGDKRSRVSKGFR